MMLSPTPHYMIIEAPGKLKRLEMLLKKMGRFDQLIATGGHFYHNPKAVIPVAIDDNLMEMSRLPDSRITKKLEAIPAQSHVYIATDSDDEGDVIARDVLCHLGHVDCVERIHFSSLTVKAIRKAIMNAKPVSLKAALPGDLRRKLDRLIGATFSHHGMAVGRVSTAILGSLVQDSPVIGYIHFEVPSRDGGLPFIAKQPVTADNIDLWLSRMEESRSFGAFIPATIERERSKKIWNLNAALLSNPLRLPDECAT